MIKELINAELNNLRQEISQQIKEVETAPASEFMSVKEESKFLNLAVTTIYDKTCKGLIPFHKGEQKLYFKKSELQEWLSSKMKAAKDG